MIIVLEGCDKVGKSTLARKLAEKYNAKIIKVSQPDRSDAFKQYVGLLCDCDPNKNYIFDRFHLGEIVYGPLYRRGSAVTLDKQHYIELKLMRHQGVLIYCSTDSREISYNFDKDKEEFTKKDDILKIMLGFESAVKRSILPTYVYNYLKIKPENVFSFVDFNSEKNKINLDFIGTQNPAVLFVGDKLNEKSVERNGFSSVFCSPSGMFLVATIRSLSWLGKSAIINSTELEKGSLVDNVLTFKPKIIISLGTNAWAVLAKNKISSLAASHPQYAKRFYGKDATSIYAEELAEKVKHGLLFKRWD